MKKKQTRQTEAHFSGSDGSSKKSQKRYGLRVFGGWFSQKTLEKERAKIVKRR